MATKAIKLNYLSAERFLKDYEQLRKGKIFLPTRSPLPLKTRLTLNITVPDISLILPVEGVVLQALDPETASRLQKHAGMVIGLIGAPEAALQDLNTTLSTNEHYRTALGLTAPEESLETASEAEPPESLSRPDSALTDSAEPLQAFQKSALPSDFEIPPADASAEKPFSDETTVDVSGEAEPEPEESDALTMEWIREAIAQEESAREKELVAEVVAAPPAEKKQLTLIEREKVKPSGEFLMDLTKAMLRSGYYAQDHPGSKGAKKGLYDAFQRCLGESREIMITNQETREKTDILITGILDEPVNVRTLVGSGMAELFVPKLREYFKRKGLVSFAIKKDISLVHFERFVDIMSDPKADSGQNAKVGELLSKALAESGITQISTVFMDDLIVLELNLPWRVEMAIQRLAKDLKVLPMFRSESEETIRKMKLQIIQDILRPLKHPEFLKDLIINCYIIAQHVEGLKTEDIEKVIIDAFPLNSLLPTSNFIFEELNRLRAMQKEHEDNPTLNRRFAGVKRILKWVSRRLVMEDVRGAQSFLEQLYLNKILAFEELPSDVQYLVNTDKMAKDVQSHVRSYVNRIVQARTPADAVTWLKLFRRVLPIFIEKGNWKIILWLTKAVNKAAKDGNIYAAKSGLPANPLDFVVKGNKKEIVAAYEKADDAQRKMIDTITDHLGARGIAILSRVLSDCEDRAARKSAMDALIKKGDLARDWVLNVLDDPEQKWYLKRNALMLLRHVGKGAEEIDRARKLLQHEHPRVRDEALNAVIALKDSGSEDLIIAALNDPDDKVRWRAMNGLSELSPISEASIKKLLGMITVAPPEDKEEAVKHSRKIVQLIRALGGINAIPNREEAEDIILDIARKSSEQKKGLLQRLKKTADPDQSTMLAAAINTLGNIGTAKSEAFLEDLARSKSPQAETAQKAANTIKLRNIEQLSDAAAGAQTAAPA